MRKQLSLPPGRVLAAACVIGVLGCGRSPAQNLSLTNNQTGLRMAVDQANSLPALNIDLPRQPTLSGKIEVLFPEHVTVREHGKTQAVHLYLWRPGRQRSPPVWRTAGQSLEYQMDLRGGIQMTARATIEPDGVRYHYRFVNGSNSAYDMIEAIWDPRMNHSVFHDARLERTYVHRHGGFELLASDTPARLTLLLTRWLPCRYLDSYTWPVPPPEQRMVKDEDGITYYNASRPVDAPFIATMSPDGDWIAATCNCKTGNVWTNPDLTCQHTDPELSLPAKGTTEWEGKTFIFKGSLQQVLDKVKKECKGRAK